MLNSFKSVVHAIALVGTAIVSLTLSPSVVTAVSAGAEADHGTDGAMLFFAIAIILIGAKVFHLIEKIKQPPVVGELLAGIVLGNLALLGIHFLTPYQFHPIIMFLAELGVIILLFQTGLESNVTELIKVGPKSLAVAIIGAVTPFVLGAYVLGPIILPNQSQHTYLFLGATLIATSVGISARVFRDAGKMQTQAAKIFLGATITDDVISLIMLAVVSSLVTGGELTAISIFGIILKSISFLAFSVILGQLAAPKLSYVFSKISSGMGTKFTIAISFCLFFSGVAQLIGLEPIIGAFAAGLVLDPVHFRRFKSPAIVNQLRENLSKFEGKVKTHLSAIIDHHEDKNVEELIEPLALFMVPIFFVVTGMSVHLETLFNVRTILFAILLTILAFGSKLLGGLVLKGRERLIVGLAMVPRGEVGLIFATVGKTLGVLNDEIFSILIVTILMTTIIAPAFLAHLLKQEA